MKLTWDDFYAICQAQKPNRFKPPDWDKVETAVAMKLAVQPGELLHAKMVEMKSRYTKQIAAMRSRTSVQRDAPCKEVVFDSDDFNLSTVVAHEVLRKKQKSLDQLGDNSRPAQRKYGPRWRSMQKKTMKPLCEFLHCSSRNVRTRVLVHLETVYGNDQVLLQQQDIVHQQ